MVIPDSPPVAAPIIPPARAPAAAPPQEERKANPVDDVLWRAYDREMFTVTHLVGLEPHKGFFEKRLMHMGRHPQFFHNTHKIILEVPRNRNHLRIFSSWMVYNDL